MLSKLFSRSPRMLALATIAATAAALPLAGMAHAQPQATLTTVLSGPTNVVPGTMATYTLTVRDIDPTNAASNVGFGFEVPHLLGTVSTFSVDNGAATCNPITGVNEGEVCGLTTLAAGASVNLSVTIHVNGALTPPMPPFLSHYASWASNANPSGLLSQGITIVDAPADPVSQPYTPPLNYNGQGYQGNSPSPYGAP